MSFWIPQGGKNKSYEMLVGHASFGYPLQLNVSKNRGKTPKMDGENNGKSYVQMDDLGVFPLFLETPIHPLLT